MSRALLEAYFQAIDAGDLESLPRFFHRDIVYERPGYDPLVGLDAVMHFYRTRRVIASGKHQVEGIVVEGDAGASWGRFAGARKDGSAIDERFADVYTFTDGKVRTRRSHFFRPAV